VSECASRMGRWGAGGRKRLLMAARARVVDEVQMYLPGFEA
ncbi:KilA-N domain-containing protein, partial [Klebsiella pneumoniae]|nr:KilA-N domain-containing protein [Klebsiella pneumoniae]